MNRIKSTGVQGFIVALAVHLVGFAGLILITPAEPARASYRPPVKVRVATPPRPKPAEVTAPEPVEVAPEKPLGKRVASRRKPRSPRPVTATPVPEQAPAAASPVRSATPRKFTVAMEATVPGGGVAVPAASGEGWAFGAPDGGAQAEKVLAGPAPAVEKQKAPAAVDAAGVTRLPRLLTQPSLADMRSAYPEDARRNGTEANVYLKILVDAQGRVTKVRVVRGSSDGFDRAALELVKRFRFRPGEVDGRAVAVWIPWTYKFRLEG